MTYGFKMMVITLLLTSFYILVGFWGAEQDVWWGDSLTIITPIWVIFTMFGMAIAYDNHNNSNKVNYEHSKNSEEK